MSAVLSPRRKASFICPIIKVDRRLPRKQRLSKIIKNKNYGVRWASISRINSLKLKIIFLQRGVLRLRK